MSEWMNIRALGTDMIRPWAPALREPLECPYGLFIVMVDCLPGKPTLQQMR